MNTGLFLSILTVVGTNVGSFDDMRDKEYGSSETLRLVQVLYRHGDRSQIRSYTNDIYKESDWPQGYGQLSVQGMEQEYVLGENLKQTYVDTGFLNRSYTRSEIYVRSTSRERALMSAYCVLSGLFPPGESERSWNSEIGWQPIPVHTVPLEQDCLLLMDCPCPVYDSAKSKFNENSATIKQTMNEFSEFFDIVSEKSGEPNTWEGIHTVLDVIFCQEANNFELPEWVTDDIFDKILELRDIYATVSSMPEDFIYLKGGLLVGEILDHMLNKSNGNNQIPQKLFMYSAHDSTVIFFLATLGIFNNRQPPYTACVIIELHELQPGKFAVQFLYKNDPNKEPDVLKLPDCDELCPLDVFAQIVKQSIPKEITEVCGLNSSTSNNSSNSNPKLATVTIVVLLCLILIFIIIVAILCCMKSDKLANTHDYMPVPLEMSEASEL